MQNYSQWLIAAIGTITIVGVLLKMKTGFGPYNTRAIGIVLVATFASILAVTENGSINAAMGILGAIAGYLFGIRYPKNEDNPKVDK